MHSKLVPIFQRERAKLMESKVSLKLMLGVNMDNERIIPHYDPHDPTSTEPPTVDDDHYVHTSSAEQITTAGNIRHGLANQGHELASYQISFKR